VFGQNANRVVACGLGVTCAFCRVFVNGFRVRFSVLLRDRFTAIAVSPAVLV